MSLIKKKYCPIRSNSFISKFTLKKLNDHKKLYLDDFQSHLITNKNLFNHKVTFVRPKNIKHISLLTNNYNNNIYDKINSIVKKENKINIRENKVIIDSSNNSILFEYNKKANKPNLNRYRYLFQDKYYYKLDYLDKKNYNDNNINYTNILNEKFTPKNKLKAINIFRTLESSDSPLVKNLNTTYNRKEYNKFNNQQKTINDSNLKINYFTSNNSMNRINNRNNYINKDGIKSLMERYNSHTEVINRNFEEVDTNSNSIENKNENKADLINNKIIIKSLSENFLGKHNVHSNKNLKINNSEKNNIELNIKIEDNVNNDINEKNCKKVNFDSYLNKFKGNQKKIMEECINKLNYNYCNDNYNYNYEINYNNRENFNNERKENDINGQINIENQINNDNDFSDIINKSNIVNNEDNKDNIIINIKNNLNKDENLNNNIIFEKDFTENKIKEKRFTYDKKDLKYLIKSSKNENRKSIDYNLIYPDENINSINRTTFFHFKEKNKNDLYFPILNDDNKRSKYTKLIKKSQQKLDLLLNKIPKHEYTRENIKDKYSLNISKFINGKKRISINIGKESNGSKLIKYLKKNKKNIIMPPNGIISK